MSGSSASSVCSCSPHVMPIPMLMAVRMPVNSLALPLIAWLLLMSITPRQMRRPGMDQTVPARLAASTLTVMTYWLMSTARMEQKMPVSRS